MEQHQSVPHPPPAGGGRARSALLYACFMVALVVVFRAASTLVRHA